MSVTLTPDEIAALQARLTQLQEKLAARKDQPGFAQNTADIQTAIDDINARLNPPAP